jgi:prepilin-type N-terminal cleavage/methylation domain-containing protein
MPVKVRLNAKNGFSLLEIMIALAILSFGLLAAGPLLYRALSSDSLTRSKGTAAISAQNKLEYLADLYLRNPSAGELMLGSHGPEQSQTANPADGTILNRYDIDWTVSLVPDPRPGKTVHARLVSVRITPIQLQGAENSRPAFNKILCVSTVFSTDMRGQAP